MIVTSDDNTETVMNEDSDDIPAPHDETLIWDQDQEETTEMREERGEERGDAVQWMNQHNHQQSRVVSSLSEQNSKHSVYNSAEQWSGISIGSVIINLD